MAYRSMTDPWIVRDARRIFALYTAAGDAPRSALTKAVDASLRRLWRRKPLDMSAPRNIARYGEQYSELESLVTGGAE